MEPTHLSSASKKGKDMTLRDIAAWQFPKLVDCNPAKLSIIVGIPSLQRGAVWDAGQVELLWDSILRGFPVGALVVCDKLATQKTHSGKHGPGWPEDDISHHLLDGQQRCNAIALGFLNALEPLQENNGKMPPATLWIDLAPQLPRGSTRQFLFRMLTTAQPWGYLRNDAADFLGIPGIRKAVEKYGDGKRPEIIAAWPHESCAPIPFAWLTNAVFVENVATSHLWTNILQKCRDLSGRNWADEAAKIIEGHLNGRAPSKHLGRIEHNLLNTKLFTIVALNVPKSALQEKSYQEEAGDGSKPDDGNRIYNVEHLFQRLNSAGTELRGEELTFSMIKAYWPSIEQSFDAIHDKAGNHWLPMAGSRLATLGARAALIGFGQYSGKKELRPPLSIGSIRTLKYDPTAKAEKEQLQQYLGIERDDIQESDLHKNLQQIDDWLIFDSSIENDCGIPPVLRSSLAQDAPDVFLLLLHFAQKARHDDLGKDEIAALRKPVLGLATALHWFGDDRAKAVGNLYSTHFSNGRLSPNAFAGALKCCFQSTDGKRELFKLISPVDLDKDMPVPRASDESLTDWRFWGQIAVVATDEKERMILARDTWPFFDKVRYSNALLLYGQRTFLNRALSYDPSRIDIWRGHNRPWDYDHILPTATLSNNKGKFRTVCREWVNTIGNLRAWPLEKNRSKSDDLANESIMPEDFADSLILDQEECNAFSLKWKDADDRAMAAGFMIAARKRIIRIYEDWFTSLAIGKLLSE